MVKTYPDNLPFGKYSRCYNNHKKKIISLILIPTIGAVFTIIIILGISQYNNANSPSVINLTIATNTSSVLINTSYHKFKY
jgi:hypothetical protein